ncbi:MAG: dockerin type I repeat-containing protein [Candidatus Zixiibacteriota bacterium]
MAGKYKLCLAAVFLLLVPLLASANPITIEAQDVSEMLRQARTNGINVDGALFDAAAAEDTTVFWKVVSSGGTTSQGGGIAITGTMSQTIIGVSEAPGLIVRHGFWQNLNACPGQTPGDANGDGIIDSIADVEYLIDFICSGGPPPQPLANGDPNGDCIIDTLDILFLALGSTPVECTCEDPSIGSCVSLDICQYSYCDPVFLVCPAGDAPFRVYLRDEFDNPIVGEGSVYIEFIQCDEALACHESESDFTMITAATPSDENGMVTFYMQGGRCGDLCMAVVKTNACVFDTVPVKMLDNTGDLIVSVRDDFNYSSCNDYTGEGLINQSDYALFSQHIGHRCDLDRCEMFGYALTVDPENDLMPNQQVSISLNLYNDSHDSCRVDAVGFFAEGFGLQGEVFIENVPLDTILGPGQSAAITTDYIIPDTGLGCLRAKFTTDCCSTLIVVERCFDIIWECSPEELVCYEFSIGLDSLPVLDTVWTRFLPPSGWTYWETHMPQFPLMTPDTVKFSICTPNLVNLGDTASVILTTCYDAECEEFRQFECRVMITSRTGDVNGDCRVNIGDAVYLIEYIFRGGPPPKPLEIGDVNCDGSVNIGDAVYLVNYIFRSGPEPCLVEPDVSIMSMQR